MRIISHRGNTIGSNIDRENKPDYIDEAIKSGLDVEIDVRIHNEDIYLGHDYPDTKINLDWLNIRKDRIWIHCKDLEIVKVLTDINSEFKYFCHGSDDFTITSTGHIWVHNLSLDLNHRCIIPIIDSSWLLNYRRQKVFAICSDYKNILTL